MRRCAACKIACRPSAARRTVSVVFLAELVCPDAACAEPFEARAGTVAELESLVCDCGCALRLTRLADIPEDRDEALLLISVA